MDTRLALAITGMRLNQTRGMLCQLMREHPDGYEGQLSRVADLVGEAHGIVTALNGSATADPRDDRPREALNAADPTCRAV